MWVGIEVKSEIAGSTNPQLRLNTMIHKGFRISSRPNRSRNLVAFGALQLTTGQEKVPSLLFGFFKLLVGWRLLPDGRSSLFYNIHTRRKKLPQEFNADVVALFNLLKAGKLKPAIADVVPLDDVVAVHRRIDNAEIAGKVVLDCA